MPQCCVLFVAASPTSSLKCYRNKPFHSSSNSCGVDVDDLEGIGRIDCDLIVMLLDLEGAVVGALVVVVGALAVVVVTLVGVVGSGCESSLARFDS
jgi:hypothetical protein